MMMFGRGFIGRAGHMGYGMMGGGWSWLVMAGVFLLVVALIYFMVKKEKAELNHQDIMQMKH